MAPERLLEIRELGRGPTAFQGGARVRLAARGALENAAAASLAVRPAGTHSGGEDRVCAAAVAARRRWRRGGDARFLGVDRSHARRAAREKPSGRTAVDLSLDGPILEVRVAPLDGGARRLGEALAIVDIAQARRLATDFAPVIKGVTDGDFSEKVDLADDTGATSSAATGFNGLMTVAGGYERSRPMDRIFGAGRSDHPHVRPARGGGSPPPPSTSTARWTACATRSATLRSKSAAFARRPSRSPATPPTWPRERRRKPPRSSGPAPR
jgi:hypothetical protein